MASILQAPLTMITDVFGEPLVQITLVTSITVLTMSYVGVLIAFSENMKSSRSRSWVLTLMASLVMSAGSIPYMCDFIYNGDWDVTTMHQSSITALSEGDNLLMSGSIIVSCFFMAYLILDILLGLISYPHELTLVTGWIHHSVYMCLLVVLIHNRLTPVFCLMAFLEVPTVVLALGHLSKSYRKDYLFGFLFFISRIAFHGFMIHQFYYHFPGQWWRWFAGIYPLHLYWFYAWMKQQVRAVRAKRDQDSPSSQKAGPPVERKLSREYLKRQTRGLLRMATAPLRRRH